MSKTRHFVFSVLSALTAFLMLNCGSYEHQFTEPEEATQQFLLIQLFNDTRCSSSHQMTVPLLFSVRNEDLKLCLSEMSVMPCHEWEKPNPLPDTCTAMLVHLK